MLPNPASSSASSSESNTEEHYGAGQITASLLGGVTNAIAYGYGSIQAGAAVANQARLSVRRRLLNGIRHPLTWTAMGVMQLAGSATLTYKYLNAAYSQKELRKETQQTYDAMHCAFAMSHGHSSPTGCWEGASYNRLLELSDFRLMNGWSGCTEGQVGIEGLFAFEDCTCAAIEQTLLELVTKVHNTDECIELIVRECGSLNGNFLKNSCTSLAEPDDKAFWGAIILGVGAGLSFLGALALYSHIRQQPLAARESDSSAESSIISATSVAHEDSDSEACSTSTIGSEDIGSMESTTPTDNRREKEEEAERLGQARVRERNYYTMEEELSSLRERLARYEGSSTASSPARLFEHPPAYPDVSDAPPAYNDPTGALSNTN